MHLADWLIVFLYLSFLIELVWLSVPSEASTSRLLFPKRPVKVTDNLLARVSGLSWPLKILSLVLPTVIGLSAYLLPLAVVLFPGLKNVFGHPQLPGWWVYVGIATALLGRALTLRATLQIRHQSGGPPETLNTSRIFGWSRNPILLGMHISFVGLLMTYPVWAMWLGGLIYFANMHFKVVLEERFLKDKYGEPFVNYCRMTPRYF